MKNAPTSPTLHLDHLGDDTLWTSDLRWLVSSRLRYVLGSELANVNRATVQLWPQENGDTMATIALFTRDGRMLTAAVSGANRSTVLCVVCNHIRDQLLESSVVSA